MHFSCMLLYLSKSMCRIAPIALHPHSEGDFLMHASVRLEATDLMVLCLCWPINGHGLDFAGMPY